MGVDAEFYVTLDQELSGDELEKLQEETAKAFPLLWSTSKGTVYPLSTRDLELLDWLPSAITVLEVAVSGRFYGHGYERGPGDFYVALGDWFEWRLPGCTIWYGDDASGIPLPFDRPARTALLEHFRAVGNEPYFCRGTG